jgi:UDP-N-acetylglucosamine 1-carboxyvinyltransferase
MVHGPSPLVGTGVQALDIRSGAAMILAGLAAEGRTTIANVVYIDRGYEDITAKIASLGASIVQEAEARHELPAREAQEPIEWGMVPVSVGAS